MGLCCGKSNSDLTPDPLAIQRKPHNNNIKLLTNSKFLA